MVRWRETNTLGLDKFLDGKRVVLVGPAASLMGRGLGPEIDAYDVVARINLASPVVPERYNDVGSRTDVLFHVFYRTNDDRRLGREHTKAEVRSWVADGVKYLVTRQEYMNDRTQKVRPLLGSLPLVIMDGRVKEAVKRETKTNPNTGTLAIAHLLSFNIASLHVTGFDFYATGYYPGYGGFTEEQANIPADGVGYAAWGQLGRTREVHKQDGQMEYLARLYRTEPRLTFDHIAAERLGIAQQGETVVAIVPIKEHSERVPGKNMRPLAGKPLLYWALAALHESRRVSQVVVDTDSETVAAMVRKYHPRTRILMRSERLRGDMVNANMLIEADLPQLEGEHFGQFHVTSPLLTSETIDRAVGTYFDKLRDHDSLFAVTQHQSWFYDHEGKPLNATDGLPRTQDMPPIYEDNSAIHLFSRESFTKTGSRTGERPQMFPISKVEGQDIDHEEDFLMCEAVMRLRHA